MTDVRSRLASDFHQSLYRATYQSLLDRVQEDGYFQESLTGAYAGMFPRTVGGLVSLFLETGELERSERLIGFTLYASRVNRLERVAHVIGPQTRALEPVPAPGSIVQPDHPISLYRLDQPDRFGGAQEFRAPDGPLVAVELWLSGHDCDGSVELHLAPSLDADPIAVSRYDAALLAAGGGWARFPFDPPPNLTPGATYVLRAAFPGKGVPCWWGIPDARDHPLEGGHGRDTQMAPGWLDNPGHVTAFALDTGRLDHVECMRLPIYSRLDQIDGQAHILLAWARLALRRGPTPFEEETWDQVALLMDRSSDWPYLTPYNPGPPIALAFTGLVRNVCFEHSRDCRFWDTFDLLTQAFVCSALGEMVRVAERRGDAERASRWRERLEALERAVADGMTRELDGRRVYLEMRLPDGGGGTQFGGLSWVNLSPVAAQWPGVERDTLRNTIEAYREHATIHWQDREVLAAEWWPDRPLGNTVIGKGTGWELVYSLDEGEYDVICRRLDFIQAINTAAVYMENAGLDADGKTWHLGDPGNGEQCSWWCWAMSRLRRAAGLSVAPD